MNNKEFDDIIKQKLEALDTEGTVDGWELFREKWEQSNIPDETDNLANNTDSEAEVDDVFDAKLKQNMRGLRMPFNSAHWIKLKAQLESEALFKKRLFVAKTVEIIMLSLIVLVILNIWPIQNEIYKMPIHNVPMVDAIQVDKVTAENYASTQKEINLKSTKTINKVKKTISNFALTPFLHKSIDKKGNSSKFNNKKSSNIAPIQSEHKIDLNQIFPFLNDLENNIDKKQESKLENLGIAVLLNTEINQIKIPKRPMGYPDMSIGSLKEKKEEKSFVSLGFGPKVNLVNSPFDPVYEIDPYNTLNTNFNISAKVHKEVGPVEIYTGLGYTNTSYRPLIIKEIYQNQKRELNHASLENIKFKIVNIPVGVNHNIIDRENIKLYASAGIDVNVVTHSDYEIYDLPATNQGIRLGVNPQIEKTEINSRSLLSQKEFNEGFLQGGSLRDNLYASASVGLGLEKNLSDRTSLYVEPKYSHFITSKGLGPNLDKVHALSIDVGVRFQLN